MKKLVAILLLLLVFFNHVTYYFVFSVQQYYIRKAVKQQLLASIPESSLERIEDSHNIKWHEEGKEFYLNGELYDVVSVKKENGRTVWLCLEDEKETKLLKALARAARARADHRGKGKKATYPHLTLDFILVTEELLPSTSLTDSQNNSYSASRLLSSPHEVKGPPPKV